jgi:hypothetical protein
MADVGTKDFDWADLCKEHEDQEKPLQYEFSNGRQFREQGNSGVYEEQGN